MVSPAPTSEPFDDTGAVDSTFSTVGTQRVQRNKVKPSRSWILWVNQVVQALNTVISYSQAAQATVVTGFSVTLINGQQILTLTPTSAIATGSIIMPPAPSNGAFVQVSTTNTVTALTVSGNAGQTLLNPPTTLLAGSSFSYYYNATASTWYRLS